VALSACARDMSRRAPPKVEEEITANLIPMIDIMFLLLLFFMLGADMGKREAEEVRLPKAIGEVDSDRRADETVVNVHHDAACGLYEGGARCEDPAHWALGVRGRTLSRTAIGPFLRDEAERVGGVDRHHVLVRADEGASYGLVQQVLAGCSQVGLCKVDLAIARRVE
jgi:biopolymer transport protein ExbD